MGEGRGDIGGMGGRRKGRKERTEVYGEGSRRGGGLKGQKR